MGAVSSFTDGAEVKFSIQCQEKVCEPLGTFSWFSAIIVSSNVI